MDVKELRLNNLVNRKFWNPEPGNERELLEAHSVCLIRENSCNLLIGKAKTEFKYSDIYGIPLTEEWLFRFGFGPCYDPQYHQIIPYDNSGTGYGVNFDGSILGFYSYRGDIIRMLVYDEEIFRYVHQLQNIYFALTGTELELNK